MAKYEVTLLFPKAEKSGKKTAEKLFKAAGVKVGKAHDWKMRELAYPIDKQTEAHYWFFETEAEPKQIVDLESKIKLEESVLRSLVVKTK